MKAGEKSGLRKKIEQHLFASPLTPNTTIARTHGTSAPYVCRIRREMDLPEPGREKEMPGLSCPECGSTDLTVTDSRPGKWVSAPSIRRRRSCTECHFRFSTHEISVDELDLPNDRLRHVYDLTVAALGAAILGENAPSLTEQDK